MTTTADITVVCKFLDDVKAKLFEANLFDHQMIERWSEARDALLRISDVDRSADATLAAYVRWVEQHGISVQQCFAQALIGRAPEWAEAKRQAQACEEQSR